MTSLPPTDTPPGDRQSADTPPTDRQTTRRQSADTPPTDRQTTRRQSADTPPTDRQTTRRQSADTPPTDTPPTDTPPTERQSDDRPPTETAPDDRPPTERRSDEQQSDRPVPDELADELLAVATEAAEAAAEIIASEAGKTRRDVSTKSSPTDLVSEVDREAERRVVAVLSKRRPDDAIVAEEGTSRPGMTGVRWVIDPLDGTTNFLFGVPAYAVSVAAEVDGRAIVGVVIDPSRHETWRAIRGRGATLNDKILRLAAHPPSLATSLVATGFSYLPDRRAYQGAIVSHVLPRVRDIRRFGAAALDLCWVAAGRVNAYYELGLQPWDLAAGVLIAEEAGAEAALLADGTTLVAAPGLLGPLRQLIEAGTPG